MKPQRRRRVRVEVALAAVSAVLLVLTVAVPEWIEACTQLEPDAGSGAVELVVAAAADTVATKPRRESERSR